ncbi:hypothetical protein [Actinomadura algeriensis]|uniref:Uncharacterized protein n=1 Tax=Actinomadura algeriensis TaxID=1679523 RepID=A0ABR9K2V9_9ACTN|nr:hypothetical protein [Actinomadura algeriensis]MBE1536866.1 hypothetical protein [Actinomadura algeriensis]
MNVKIGQTLVSVVDGTSLVVVRCSGPDVVVTCGGEEMVDKAVADAAAPAGGSGGARLGKRYTVEGLDIELLCVKAGGGQVAVNGTPVVEKSAKPLPASD